ncbi:MAG: hypothetical protein J1E39_03225 [Eubacterium sp.]|nr:hypothetical protein [Eubacterium sp.]
MDAEEKEFSFNCFWGNETLKPFVEFSRKGTHYCIYCGSIANTREHVPSKAFLKRPLPSDPPVLPACEKCNNSFSPDELYTRTYIECLKAIFVDNNLEILQIDPDDRKEKREAKISIKEALDQKHFVFDNRIGRILLKLAIGHVVYELSENYYFHDWDGDPLYTKYIMRSTISETEWEKLECAEVMNDKMLPEIGSRVFRNIFVVQPILEKMEGDGELDFGLFMMDWADIQDDMYRYITYLDRDKLVVKMIIMDFLYGEVVFQEKRFDNIENK